MILNELGDQGGLNNILQRRLNMVGSSPAPSLMPEISPTLVLEVERPEWATWKREMQFSGYVAEPGAGAGTWTSIFIAAPDGQLVVIQDFVVSLAANDIDFGWCAAPPAYTLTSIWNPTNRDTSGPANAPVSMLSGTTAALPAFVGFQMGRAPNSVGIRTEGPWVLRPNSRGLLLRASVVNQTLRVTFRGYTRPLLPNELV